MTGWTTQRAVRFSHCDPAGIVYYPRYFDLIHEAKEDWLRDAVGVPLPTLIGRGRGLPIVRLEADFVAPSRFGDVLDIVVTVPRVGGASLHLDYDVACGAQRRMKVRTVVVHMALAEGRPVPFDEDLRARFARFAPAMERDPE